MSIYILFGRPGSGKSTVASSTILSTYFEQNNHIAVDLDICITQSMKDNFALEIYPTLEERNQFAISACNYVDECIRKSQCHSCLITFSFVNTDLREIFRARFPTAKWILIDTNASEADKRIVERQGHFYKNKMSEKVESSGITTSPNSNSSASSTSEQKERESSTKGPEWKFADVDFEHVRLNGLDRVDDNVNKLIAIMESH